MRNCKKVVSVGFITLVLAGIFMLTAYAAGLKITSQPKTVYTAYGKTATVTVEV